MSDAATPNLPSRDFEKTSRFYSALGFGEIWRERVHRAVERYWRKMLGSRSWHGTVYWKQFQRIKEQFPLLRPKLYLPYRELQALAVL